MPNEVIEDGGNSFSIFRMRTPFYVHAVTSSATFVVIKNYKGKSTRTMQMRNQAACLALY